MDTLLTAVLPAVAALLGVGLTLFAEGRRTRAAARAAAVEREEKRLDERRSRSEAPAREILTTFAKVRRTATARYFTYDPDRPPFEDDFPEWWEDIELPLLTSVELIPGATYREALVTVIEGIGNAQALGERLGFAQTYQDAVAYIATVGVEVAAAWTRGDPNLAESTAASVRSLRSEIDTVNDMYREEHEWRVEAHREERLKARSTAETAREAVRGKEDTGDTTA